MKILLLLSLLSSQAKNDENYRIGQIDAAWMKELQRIKADYGFLPAAR